MSFKIIVHADDFGISRGGTEKILEGCDAKILSSISIVPNGLAFEYAIQEFKKRPHLRLSVHLNLLEGYSISRADEISHIVDEKGRFYHSFLGLWMKYSWSNSSGKDILKQQVKKEMGAQIQKVIDCLGSDLAINVDSHNHYHIIPFVFEALLELVKEFDITYIRIPEEKYFWCLSGWRSVGRYISSNVIKHHLLNMLSRGYKKRLVQLSISYPEYFIGVLFSGHMSGKAVSAALGSLSGDVARGGIVEILFHPGRAGRHELIEWTPQKRFNDYYCSPSRDQEFHELTNPAFKHLIENFTNII